MIKEQSLTICTKQYCFTNIFWRYLVKIYKKRFRGGKSKVKKCFTNDNFCYVLLLQSEDLEDIIKIKEKAQQRIDIGNQLSCETKNVK